MSGFEDGRFLAPDEYLVAPVDTQDPHILLQQAEALLYAYHVTGTSAALHGVPSVLEKVEASEDPQLSLRRALCWAEVNTIFATILRSDVEYDNAFNAWSAVAVETSEYSETTRVRVTRALGTLGQHLLRTGRPGHFDRLRTGLLEDDQNQSPFSELARAVLSDPSLRPS